ncbi:hypothetical protein WJX81_001011 [Elliptochloris bilobata]|uniref:30S ribosomal protein S20, chloroplastic n=1 Tax=Elliptochloris bilobata TaxID=381761 RepID=A0AAW1SK73_9CHLO
MATHQLTRALGNMSVSGSRAPSSAAPSFGFCSCLRGQSLTGAERRRSVAARGAVAVFAKQNAKQRERLAEKQRQYNKSRKSAVATRMRKVFKAIADLGQVQEEAALAPVEKLISEAYKEVDKAVSKGVIHKNTAARRKSRLAAAKRSTLINSGLYTPAPAA